LLTATQDVAYRGHREASIDGNANTGNFLQILQLVARHDDIVVKKITSAPKNAKYTGHQIQNDVIDVLGGLVRQSILDEVRDAEYFSIIVDETKDISKRK